jgi:hypothetical protein
MPLVPIYVPAGKLMTVKLTRAWDLFASGAMDSGCINGVFLLLIESGPMKVGVN